MAKVRDTKNLLASVQSKGVIDFTTISNDEWETILTSVIKGITPKQLHGFETAADILRNFRFLETENTWHGQLPRIWLGDPNRNPEFHWNHQYLLCAVRPNYMFDLPPDRVSRDLLLLGKDSSFYILTVTANYSNGRYVFSLDTKKGHISVRPVSIEDLVAWCQGDADDGPVHLRKILEYLYASVLETERDLAGKLERICDQRQRLDTKLAKIAWVKSGTTVWLVHHHHSWDREYNNEYFPISRVVELVKDGCAHFADHPAVAIERCHMTEKACQAACPKSHMDD